MLRRSLAYSKVVVVMVALCIMTIPLSSQAAPKRIVSLNPCLDTILVNVADFDQIAALSHYARDPSASTISEIAQTLPFTSDSAEQIIALAPDLILSAGHSSLATRKALQRIGMKSELFPVPNSIADSLEQIRKIAALVGHPERGEALILRIQAAIEAARPPHGHTTYTALLFQTNGLAAGTGTLADEMMTLVGFKNIANHYGIRRWGNVGLEQLLAHPPQILLADGLADDKPRWADRILSHAVLRNTEQAFKRVNFPKTLLFCGGPVLIKTAQALSKARAEMEARP